jgi:hypothetical protein
MFTARALKTGLSVLALCGAFAAWSLPAEAGSSTGTWRNGMVDGPYGPGYYGPNGEYYGGGRQYRRRGYARESYRVPRHYGGRYVYGDPYAGPRGYRSRGYGYGDAPDWYRLEQREQEFRAYDSQRSR